MEGPTASPPPAAGPGEGAAEASFAGCLRRAAARRLRLMAARREVQRGLARGSLHPETARRLRAELAQLAREVQAAGWCS